MIVCNRYLDGIILSILEKKEGLYPYEIAKQICIPLSLSDTTVYGVCRRLIREGYIREDSKSHIVNGRMRKYYLITEKGCEKLFNLKQMYQLEREIIDHCLGS